MLITAQISDLLPSIISSSVSSHYVWHNLKVSAIRRNCSFNNQRAQNSWFSGLLRRAARWSDTNVSEDRAPSIFRVEVLGNGKWNFIFNAVITSNVASYREKFVKQNCVGMCRTHAHRRLQCLVFVTKRKAKRRFRAAIIIIIIIIMNKGMLRGSASAGTSSFG
jgi:hypothetical protein